MGGAIVMAVYCVLVLGAGTLAWRRMKMPAEVQRKQFKVLGITVAFLAIFSLLLYLIVSQLQTLSPGVFMTILFTAIVLGVAGLVVAVRRVTLPKTVPLPPTANMIRTNRDKLLKHRKGFGIFIVAILLIAAVVPRPFFPVVLIVGGTLALIYILAWTAGYLQARTADEGLSRLAFDAPIRWQIAPALWAEWVDSEVARTVAAPPRFLWRRDWTTPAIMLAVAGGILLFVGGAVAWRVGVFLGFTCLVLLAIFLGRRQQRTEPARLRSALATSSPIAFFGAEGYACGGVFTSWMATDCFLTSAAVVASGPRRLAFVFRKTVPSGRTFRTFDALQTVPIPPGGEADLAALREQLTVRCPEARIAAFTTLETVVGVSKHLREEAANGSSGAAGKVPNR